MAQWAEYNTTGIIFGAHILFLGKDKINQNWMNIVSEMSVFQFLTGYYVTHTHSQTINSLDSFLFMYNEKCRFTQNKVGIWLKKDVCQL